MTLPTIPYGIAARPDGKLWVALASSGQVLLLDPDGPDVIHELDTWDANPMDLAVSSDGSVWFSQLGLGEIGRLYPFGGEYLLSHYFVERDARPSGVAVDVDGSLWFTRQGDGKIGKAPPPGIAGDIIEIPLPDPESAPMGIARGADGNFWFTMKSAIGRVASATGTVTEFPLPAEANALWITAGPDGALWFTDAGRNRIGRITTAGVLSDFALPTAFAAPFDIVAGPDGNLWFTELYAGRIGRITPAGSITEFSLADPGAGPSFITAGADGALWFSETAGGRVGRITTTGVVTHQIELTPTVSSPGGLAVGADDALWFLDARKARVARLDTDGEISEYLIPPRDFGFLPEPTDLTLGPDGNLWFTDATGQIGRVTPAGVVDVFELPDSEAGRLFPGPLSITVGPDAYLWFTDFRDRRLGRVATDGTIELVAFDAALGSVRPTAIVTGPDGNLWIAETDGQVLPGGVRVGRLLRMTPAREFTAFPIAAGRDIFGLVVGPDGNLWFTLDNDSNAVGRMTLDGVVTTFPLPGAPFTQGPDAITVGPDGNLWFTERENNRIGRITTAGVITEYEVPTADAQVNDIVAGPDGAMWFSEGHAGKLGRLATPGVGTCLPSSTRLCVDDAPGDRRFAVEVEFETSQGGGLAGDASAIPLAGLGIARGGVFYFTNPANPEMLLKVLNGCAITGSYWVFSSAGTNVGLTTTVTDTITGNFKVYTNPDRKPAVPVQDTGALLCGEGAAAVVAGASPPASAVAPSPLLAARARAASLAPAASAAACVPSATRLCVDHLPGDGRFAVEVEFETSQGGGLEGDAPAIPLASLGIARGGVFYFTNPANPEMLLKVLDGCAITGSFWVFYSAGTNVGLTTTVTDTATGYFKVYTNADGTPAPPVQDTAAFPCP